MESILQKANINPNNITTVVGYLQYFRDVYGNSYHGGYVAVFEDVNGSIVEHSIKVPYRYGYGEPQNEMSQFLGLDHDNFIRVRNARNFKVSGEYGLKREIKRILSYADSMDYKEV